MRRGVVVLGGNGYLGSSICRTAVRSAGLRCSSIARSGPPPNYRVSLALLLPPPPIWVRAAHSRGGQRGMKDVQWLRGDAARLSEHRDVLAQASAVISCVGAFGSNQCAGRLRLFAAHRSPGTWNACAATPTSRRSSRQRKLECPALCTSLCTRSQAWAFFFLGTTKKEEERLQNACSSSSSRMRRR